MQLARCHVYSWRLYKTGAEGNIRVRGAELCGLIYRYDSAEEQIKAYNDLFKVFDPEHLGRRQFLENLEDYLRATLVKLGLEKPA